MGIIAKDVEQYFLKQYSELRDLLKPFLHCFDVTYAERRELKNTMLYTFLLKPENFIKEGYGLDKEVIFFMRGSENYFYKIINNRKLNYFDLPNYGNYGYNGVNKMMKKNNKKHDVYFVIDKELVANENDNQQYIKELGEEVINKSELVKTIGLYEIYYKK